MHSGVRLHGFRAWPGHVLTECDLELVVQSLCGSASSSLEVDVMILIRLGHGVIGGLNKLIHINCLEQHLVTWQELACISTQSLVT